MAKIAVELGGQHRFYGKKVQEVSVVTIQSANVNPDGTFLPSAPYTLNPKGSQLTCYVPALSAVLIQIA